MLFRRVRDDAHSANEKPATSSSSGREVMLVKHRVYGLVLDAYTPPGEACFVHGKGRLSLPGIVLAAGKAVEELVRVHVYATHAETLAER